jgi:hypothetical protein
VIKVSKKTLQIRRSRRFHGKRKKRIKRTTYKKIYGHALGFGNLPPIKRLYKGSEITIYCPSIFSLAHNSDETLHFFEKVTKAILKDKYEKVIIDHTLITKIDPEVALLMNAEFDKLNYHSPFTNLQGRFNNASEDVMEVLFCVGYLGSFYPKLNWKNRIRIDKRIYLKKDSGNLVTAKDVHDLVDDLCEISSMNETTNKRLRVALIELMDNAVAHAYASKKANFRRPQNKWWMMAYKDFESGDVVFILLDQGIGMPATLSNRYVDRGLLIPRDEEEMVRQAFEKSFSSTKKKNRGLGLPGLRKFVEKTTFGELLVQTKNVHCTITSIIGIKSKKTASSLQGTLIRWNTNLN